MERKVKLTIAKAAVVLGAIPLLLWAYEYGPDPGYCGVPKENGTCTAAGCHTGTTNDPANKGSVAINFPNGMTYTPGVTQQLTVTIADPAASQTAWGFEVTPRVASDPATMAGTMLPVDKNTALMCSQANFAIFEAVCLPGADPQGRCTPMSAPSCSSLKFATTLQYMEHSYTGYLSTMGAGSGTYNFDWTPPSTNVGNITFYIAGNAGVGGPPTQNGDHIYATTYTVTPGVALTVPPAVTNVISASGFGAFTSAAPGSYIEIYGSNLAPDTRTWLTGDFTGNAAPTSLDGTRVTIGGQQAYVSFISLGQVNAQVPSGVSTGSQAVTVTTSVGTSSAFTLNVNPLEPGLLAPSSFLVNGKQYVVAQHLNGTYVLPKGLISGVTSSPAAPGETITIYGVGFGPAKDTSNNTIPAGQIAPASSALANAVQMQVGGKSVTLTYQGLAPSLVGAYQFNVTAPSGVSGDSLLTFTQSGTPSTQMLYLSM